MHPMQLGKDTTQSLVWRLEKIVHGFHGIKKTTSIVTGDDSDSSGLCKCRLGVLHAISDHNFLLVLLAPSSLGRRENGLAVDGTLTLLDAEVAILTPVGVRSWRSSNTWCRFPHPSRRSSQHPC